MLNFLLTSLLTTAAKPEGRRADVDAASGEVQMNREGRAWRGRKIK